jgi:hypothetical protein
MSDRPFTQGYDEGYRDAMDEWRTLRHLVDPIDADEMESPTVLTPGELLWKVVQERDGARAALRAIVAAYDRACAGDPDLEKTFRELLYEVEAGRRELS